jgi:hypothetical protein
MRTPFFVDPLSRTKACTRFGATLWRCYVRDAWLLSSFEVRLNAREHRRPAALHQHERLDLEKLRRMMPGQEI